MEIINAKSSTFKEHGFEEFWLQDEICKKSGDTKTIDLPVLQKERIQSSSGRIDVLLKDPEDNLMYEVEVMLYFMYMKTTAL